MPLADLEPKLDDRTFESLFEELRLRIPRYAPQWTNYNDSDPGITLLQLFAWLSELMLAQMNRIPKKNYISFLRLLGIELRPAQPATAHLTFTTKASQTAASLPARTQVSASLPDGGPPLIFETTRALDPIQAPLVVVGVSDAGSMVNVTAANEKSGTTFRPFGWAPTVGSALYLGFEALQGITVRPFPEEMTFRVFLPPDPAGPGPQRVNAPVPIAPVTLLWEYRPRDGAEWERLNVYEDETAAFTREGYIRVEGPAAIELSNERRLDPKNPRYWIRARLDARRYPGGEGPMIDIIRANTVEAENLTTVRNQILGTSDGTANQTFTLPYRPVDAASLVISSEDANGGHRETWTRAETFYGARPDERKFTLNPTAGTIRFGDGLLGFIPSAGFSIVADEFRYGGGARANDAGTGSINGLVSSPPGIDKVTNERRAVGGSNEQTLADLQQEAPDMVKRRERAVTADDFKAYALEGGDVANAIALARTHPDFPGVDVPGAVTVIVVPTSDDRPPMPSIDLIESVCTRLSDRRLLTTEVYVTAADYRRVRVEAFIEAEPKASFDAISRNATQALDTLIDPKKWRFGDDLFPTRIYKELLEIDNVVSIRNLNVYVDGRLHDGLGQIPLQNTELPYSADDHLIVVTPAQNR